MPPVRLLNLLSRFRRFRADRFDAVLTRDGLRVLHSAARPRVLVARSLLRVRCVALPEQISAADRWGALRAQALAWQPFERAVVRVGQQKSQGILVAWDATLAEQVQEQLGVPAGVIHWLPELALHEPTHGLQLLKGEDGFELRCAEGGLLLRSRWWPNIPDSAQWAETRRTLPPAWAEAPLPAAADTAPAGSWIDLRPVAEDAAQRRRQERWWVAGAGLALWLVSVPVFRAQMDLRRERADLETQLAARQQAGELQRQQQQHALALNERAHRLAQDLDGSQPLMVLAHLADTLPPEGVQLREFDLEGKRLRLVFEVAPGVSRGALVSRLQRGGWFAEVAELNSAPRAGWVAYGVTLTAHRYRPMAPAAQASAARTGARTGAPA